MNPLFQSKKWTAAALGGLGILLVFGVTTTAIFFAAPEKSVHLTSIATHTITVLGGLLGAFVAGQSFVDVKEADAENNNQATEK